LAVMVDTVEKHIDMIKTTSGDVDVILVGGGSIILPDKLNGVKKLYKPEHFDCANAFGSAMAKVSGTCEKLIPYDKIPRHEAIKSVRKEAFKIAMQNGALKDSIEIVDESEVSLSYFPDNTHRVKVRVAGELKTED